MLFSEVINLLTVIVSEDSFEERLFARLQKLHVNVIQRMLNSKMQVALWDKMKKAELFALKKPAIMSKRRCSGEMPLNVVDASEKHKILI